MNKIKYTELDTLCKEFKVKGPIFYSEAIYCNIIDFRSDGPNWPFAQANISDPVIRAL